jgi:HEPN domain-containing protein
MRDKNTDAKRWFAQALRDLDDAKFNLSGKRYNVACFLAQQSVEKALKAFLLAKGAEEIWGHSTSDLCKDAQTLDSDFATVQDEAASLDKYYIPTRYPNVLPGGIPSEVFDEADANKAILTAERIIKFTSSKTGLK